MYYPHTALTSAHHKQGIFYVYFSLRKHRVDRGMSGWDTDKEDKGVVFEKGEMRPPRKLGYFPWGRRHEMYSTYIKSPVRVGWNVK